MKSTFACHPLWPLVLEDGGTVIGPWVRRSGQGFSEKNNLNLVGDQRLGMLSKA